MKLIVKARHMSLTPALKSHAEEKLGRSLMKIFDRPAAKVEIELTDLGQVKSGTKECRVTVYMPRGKTITISEVSDDMYSAINLAHDRLLHQVKRQRGRKRDTTRSRKEAIRSRNETARAALTGEPEVWETELQEYESA